MITSLFSTATMQSAKDLHLPQELLEQIFQNLDIESLLSLQLVGAPSLFSGHLNIYHPRRADRFMPLLRHCGSILHEKFNQGHKVPDRRNPSRTIPHKNFSAGSSAATKLNKSGIRIRVQNFVCVPLNARSVARLFFPVVGGPYHSARGAS